MTQYKLKDLIDASKIQQLQDKLDALCSFPAALIDNEGEVLTATAWQDVCTKFHRVHPDSRRACVESDRYITSHLHEAAPAVCYRCPHGMVDSATPIIIDGQHLGNFFTGQLFLEKPDLEFFRQQAREFGFDETEYLAAVARVPVWTRAQLDRYLDLIKSFVQILAEVGLKNQREEEARRKLSESETFTRIQRDLAFGLASATKLDEGLKLCLDAALMTVGLDAGGFYLMDETSGGLDLLVHRGLSAEFVASASHFAAESAEVRRVNQGKAMYTRFREIGRNASKLQLGEGLRFLGVIPLLVDGRVIGCFNVASHTVDAVGAAHCHALEAIAAQASHAIARLKAEDASRESGRRLHLALSAAQMGTFDADLVRHRTVWSRRHEVLWGYRPGEFAGTPQSFLERVHPDDRPEILAIMERCLNSGEPFAHEYRVVWPDGSVHWMASYGQVSHSDTGKPVRLQGAVMEITGRKEAEFALQQSERNYREIFDATSEAIFVHDAATGRVLDVNDAMLRIFGFVSRKHYLAAPPDVTFVSDPRYSLAEAQRWMRLARDVGPQVFEWKSRKQNGEEIWLEVSLRSARVTGADCILAVVRDMTARKAAEDALRTSEDRYRQIVETSFDWIWEVDPLGRYTYASPQVQTMLGFAPAEVLGRTPFDLMPPPEAKRVRATFEQIAASRQPIVALENVNLHRDGRLVVVETNGVPIFALDGSWRGYRGMDRDITARRAAEKVMRMRGAALEAAANAIVIMDPSGNIEWVNPAFTALSGWTLAEAVGRNPRILLDSGQHDELFFQQMEQTLLAGNPWQGEVINRRKDGTLRTEDMTITPLRDERGNISHFIAIKQDITERKTLEMHSRQTQRREAIGTLAGGIAHDLNNILTPILMVSGMLSDKAAREEDRELLTMLRQSAQRGAEIIRQLLAFSRGVEGKRVTVQPGHLLKEMMALMRETFPREINLQIELRPALALVSADPTQLHQVLLNLCVNARDAMPDGGHLTLAASNVSLKPEDPALPPHAKPGPFVLLEVRDSGHGIPADIQHRIFEPFFTTKGVGKGTGLGLSTVQGIVQSHGGFVALESRPGSGTVFKVFLPARPDESLPAAVLTGESTVVGQGQLLLVIDDERNVREALRRFLEGRGFRVQVAVNGKDGLTQYGEHRNEIALVITDLMMPVLNGVGFIKALRAIDTKMPVIAASGLGEANTRKELAALGVTVVLEKPCDGSVLLEAIERQLRQPK